MADIATAALVFGGFLVLFCALAGTAEWWLDRRARSRRLRGRIGRYGGQR